MSISSEQILASLHAMSDAAAQHTLPKFRSPLEVENKIEENFDPVTIADRAAEQAIRALIEEHFPDHGIIGEEFGCKNESAALQWIIDPIDGTRAFISGIPVWGTLIGLYHDGVPIAGMMSQPFTGERYWGVPNGDDLTSAMSIDGGEISRLKTREITQLGSCTLMTTSPLLFSFEEKKNYDRLESEVLMPRYGCDCYAYCLLASGHVDLVVESGLSIYDIAALIPIIRGAGGLVTNWQGADPSKGGQVLAAANQDVHARALELLNS